MHYRPEIDGLRAVAIVPVMLFHAGFGLFSGGYVGVDVFFVISGYLITSIIVPEIQEGRFSLRRFYERRARRILPALFLVLTVSLPAAALLLIPPDLQQFARSLTATMLFASNFFFWAKSDYFDTDAELQPLLHTWSLAVEEQYYIFFPLLLMLIRSSSPARTLGLFAGASGLSLLAAQVYLRDNAGAVFYLLPFRAWELLAGSMCAVWMRQAPDRAWAPAVRMAAPMVGLGLILLGIFAYDKDTLFPGLAAVPPVLGTALIILFTASGSLMYRLLSSRAMVFVGLLSYSAYLWHQPLFAFVRYAWPQGHPPLWLMGLLCLLTLVCAYLSWRFVEAPFRTPSAVSTRRIFQGALAGCTAFAALGFAGHVLQGWPGRYSGAQAELLSYLQYRREALYREGRCFLTRSQGPQAFSADCTPSQATMLLWGDSHAAALSPGLRALQPALAQLTASACPPLMGITIPRNPQCAGINQHTWQWLQQHRPATVVLHAVWSSYSEQLQALDRTLRLIRHQLPSAHIVVIGGVPQWSPYLPNLLLRHDVRLRELGPSPVLLPNHQLDKVDNADRVVEGIAKANGVDYFSARRALCQGTACEATARLDQTTMPYAWDYGHLTEAGASDLARRITERWPRLRAAAQLR